MKKLLNILIVICLLILMAICNPSKSEYVDWLKENVSGENNNILVQGILSLAGDNIIDSCTKTRNYIFFSVFYTNLENVNKIKVIGVFNNFIPLNISDDRSSSLPSESSTYSEVQDNTNSNVDKKTFNVEANDPFQVAESTSTNNTEYSTYSNGRYGFSVDYPKRFRVIETAENGDGAKIVSASDKAEILVYGSNNSSGETVKSSYENSIERIKNKIAYKHLSDNWYVLSWIENGNIKYFKEAVGAGSINTLVITYDKNLADKYNSIVETISKSFSTPETATSH